MKWLEKNPDIILPTCGRKSIEIMIPCRIFILFLMNWGLHKPGRGFKLILWGNLHWNETRCKMSVWTLEVTLMITFLTLLFITLITLICAAVSKLKGPKISSARDACLQFGVRLYSRNGSKIYLLVFRNHVSSKSWGACPRA